VACNCYSYAKILIDKLPPMKEIIENTKYPNVGGLIIIWYGNIKHIAVIEKVVKNGIYVKEANYKKCYIGKRFLTWDYLKNKEAKYWRKNN